MKIKNNFCRKSIFIAFCILIIIILFIVGSKIITEIKYKIPIVKKAPCDVYAKDIYLGMRYNQLIKIRNIIIDNSGDIREILPKDSHIITSSYQLTHHTLDLVMITKPYPALNNILHKYYNYQMCEYRYSIIDNERKYANAIIDCNGGKYTLCRYNLIYNTLSNLGHYEEWWLLWDNGNWYALLEINRNIETKEITIAYREAIKRISLPRNILMWFNQVKVENYNELNRLLRRSD